MSAVTARMATAVTSAVGAMAGGRAGGRDRGHTAMASAWQAQSLLLSYPDQALLERTALLREVARRLPGRTGGPLLRFLDHLERTPPGELADDYVATFDQRRCCCLFLTYYAHGDTRKRGVALLRLKQVYQEAGLDLVDDELPDHLAVMLEFAATGDAATGRRLLVEHRAGLELLRLALREADSPWADVLDSVSATLPSLGRDERAAVRRLAAEGPPGEEVGLAPYAATPYLSDPAGPGGTGAPRGAGRPVDIGPPGGRLPIARSGRRNESTGSGSGSR